MGSGKAFMPGWLSNQDDDNQFSVVFLSNITTHTLTVTVTFYQEDGTIAPSSALAYSNFQSGNTEIGPGQTGLVQIATSSVHYGYAVVTWGNNGSDNDLVGLIGSGYHTQSASESSANYLTINNGLPF
jgi:hypothetical protein